VALYLVSAADQSFSTWKHAARCATIAPRDQCVHGCERQGFGGIVERMSTAVETFPRSKSSSWLPVRSRRANRQAAATEPDSAPPGRLPAWAERRLVVAAKAGDPRARQELIEAFEPMIRSVARIYSEAPVIERAELMQEGAVGLLRALQRYDLSLGVPFWAYASWWVRQSMQQVVSELTRPVVLSDRAARKLARVGEARREHVRMNWSEPTTAELAARSGLTVRQVENLQAAERSARSLDAPLGGRDADETLRDLIASPGAEDAFDRVDQHSGVERLPGLLGELSDREREIVHGRYGIDGDEQTLGQLGARLGVSDERVRQIEKGALVKMQLAADSALVTGRSRARRAARTTAVA
jgi:RNA polymerase primary sigma factor